MMDMIGSKKSTWRLNFDGVCTKRESGGRWGIAGIAYRHEDPAESSSADVLCASLTEEAGCPVLRFHRSTSLGGGISYRWSPIDV